MKYEDWNNQYMKHKKPRKIKNYDLVETNSRHILKMADWWKCLHNEKLKNSRNHALNVLYKDKPLEEILSRYIFEKQNTTNINRIKDDIWNYEKTNNVKVEDTMIGNTEL